MEVEDIFLIIGLTAVLLGGFGFYKTVVFLVGGVDSYVSIVLGLLFGLALVGIIALGFILIMASDEWFRDYRRSGRG